MPTCKPRVMTVADNFFFTTYQDVPGVRSGQRPRSRFFEAVFFSAAQIFELQVMPLIACSSVKSANRDSTRKKKRILLYVQIFEQTPRPTAVVAVWRREEARRVRCTGPRTQ